MPPGRSLELLGAPGSSWALLEAPGLSQEQHNKNQHLQFPITKPIGFLITLMVSGLILWWSTLAAQSSRYPAVEVDIGMDRAKG